MSMYNWKNPDGLDMTARLTSSLTLAANPTLATALTTIATAIAAKRESGATATQSNPNFPAFNGAAKDVEEALDALQHFADVAIRLHM